MLRRSALRSSCTSRLLLKQAQTSPAWSRRASTGPLRPSSALFREKLDSQTEARSAGGRTSGAGQTPPTYGPLITWGIPAFLAFIATVGWKSVKRESKSDATSAPPVPQLRDDLTEASVSTKSPVEAIDLETANAKLREDCHTFSFNAQGNRRGRVDVVRLSSNDPVEDFWDVAMGKGVGGNQTLYSGIYDGHAGWATAKILEKTLVPLVSIALSQLSPTASREAVEDTIKRTFLRLDKRIDDRALEAMETGYMSGAAEVIAAIAPAIAGSCALLTTFDVETSTLRTAVTGDSRAVRGAWSSDDKTYKADCLSHDQTGLNRHEVKRIDAEHPGEKEKILDSRTGRLLGLAVTRAFGDHRWKWTKQQIEKARDNFYGTAPRPDYETPPYMSAEPEITMRKIQTEDFVILASDGLWGRMNNDDAVACISRWLVAVKAGKPEPFQDTQRKDDDLELWRTNSEHFVIEDLDNAAVCLAKNALGGSRRKVFLGLMSTSAPTSRGARDDITIQVIFFKDPHQTS